MTLWLQASLLPGSLPFLHKGAECVVRSNNWASWLRIPRGNDWGSRGICAPAVIAWALPLLNPFGISQLQPSVQGVSRAHGKHSLIASVHHPTLLPATVLKNLTALWALTGFLTTALCGTTFTHPFLRPWQSILYLENETLAPWPEGQQAELAFAWVPTLTTTLAICHSRQQVCFLVEMDFVYPRSVVFAGNTEFWTVCPSCRIQAYNSVKLNNSKVHGVGFSEILLFPYFKDGSNWYS